MASWSLSSPGETPRLSLLASTNGLVAGPQGAARLGLKRTKLISRMKKFRIDPHKLS
jgi:transcriptional regulator with GAF, ATPase, and Fis domain